MPDRKLKRGEVDRWTGNAITGVKVPSENKKAAAEINAQLAKKNNNGKQNMRTKKK